MKSIFDAPDDYLDRPPWPYDKPGAGRSRARSKGWIWISSFAALGVVAYLDYVTGHEVSLSFFYLIPISLAAWFIGYKSGVFFSLLSTIVWMTILLRTGEHYSREWLPVWNGLMRFGFSTVTSLCISKVHVMLVTQTKLVGELTASTVDGWEIGRLLPVCGGCKTVRLDDAYVEQVKAYLESHPKARFISHDCPVCAKAKTEQEAKPALPTGAPSH